MGHRRSWGPISAPRRTNARPVFAYARPIVARDPPKFPGNQTRACLQVQPLGGDLRRQPVGVQDGGEPRRVALGEDGDLFLVGLGLVANALPVPPGPHARGDGALPRMAGAGVTPAADVAPIPRILDRPQAGIADHICRRQPFYDQLGGLAFSTLQRDESAAGQPGAR